MSTLIQRLNNTFGSGVNTATSTQYTKVVHKYSGLGPNDVIYSTNNKEDYQQKLLQLRQQRLLAKQWKRAQYETSNNALANQTEVQMMYREADMMDLFPEIGAALDIYMEEACLSGDTKIKLLNGLTKTIKQLFDDNANNFWVYAVDENGQCKPSLVERVIDKGTKQIYEITLDDGTVVKCTGDHNWLLSDNKWRSVSELNIGDSLMSINSCFSHSIISITKTENFEQVYDLYNSSTNNCFGVQCNNGLIISHNCYTKPNSKMINVTSKSERIKTILEDLIYNRLSANIIYPMITRSTVKYGNTFMLLNITEDNGIVGWKQLPVYEMQRFENGMDNPYSSGFANLANIDADKEDSTKFVWVGKNEFVPYRNWQIAHFRLLYDSLYLPYGVSALNKARRHWRMLSMMEDMMLMYRLERSVERRVFKVNVGAIDEEDVPSYMDEIANNFKRTPIIDPLTGQLDLRKGILTQMDDYFIPVRDPSEPSPIESLPGAQNLTAMDDIKFVQGKLCTALRVPLSFLNFETQQGDGKNLSMLDVRFTRTINRVQQMMLMELNKVCIIHLYLLGFEDELTNFQLSMNNPSSQAEMMELENLSKKIEMAKSAVADPGGGLPIMSITRAQKEILGWSEKEISDNLDELRLEKAISTELEQTAAIIKRTGLFDRVDNIYGEPGAEYGNNAGGQGQEDGGMPGGGGGGLGMPMGDDMGMGEDTEGDLGGADGEMDMGDAAEAEGAPAPEGESEPLQESFVEQLLKNTINKQKEMHLAKVKHYQKLLMEHRNKDMILDVDRANVPIYEKNFLVNEELNNIANSLNEKMNMKKDNLSD